MNDSIERKHRDRLFNFISVPAQLEWFLFTGYITCLDVFLDLFTTLPFSLLTRSHNNSPNIRADLHKILFIAVGLLALLFLNPSHMYHSIRGQSTVKLYVIFNLLEVADKLCASFGVDVLMASCSAGAGGDYQRVMAVIGIGGGYAVIHSVVVFCQLMTLNVAINSYSNALLTLLVSNQFIELKSAVFKKFDTDNLFQLSCGDVIERFQLSLYLTLLCFNVDILHDHDRIVFAMAAVWGSELVVDWLKHAFIGKFNHIHSHVYSRSLSKVFTELRCGSDVVAKRMGFTVVPFASVFLRLLIGLPISYIVIIYTLMIVAKMVTSRLIVRLANHYDEAFSKTDQ